MTTAPFPTHGSFEGFSARQIFSRREVEQRMARSTEFDLSSDDLLDIDEVCAFFGGTRPLNPSTIWRGAGTKSADR